MAIAIVDKIIWKFREVEHAYNRGHCGEEELNSCVFEIYVVLKSLLLLLT